MSTPEFTIDRAHHLLDQITQADDGAHVIELLELIHGVADPESVIAQEVERLLYALTPDFQLHFKEYLDKMWAA